MVNLELITIPKDWNIISLKEKTTKIGSGITPRGGERVYKKEGRPFVRSQNVGWGNLILEDVAFIDEKTHSLFNSTEIKIDDVLLNITGASIGRSAVADSRVKKGNVNQHVCIIRTNSQQLIPHYVNHFLLSKIGQQQIDMFQAGGNREGLNFGQIGSIQILSPTDIDEQEKICHILLDINEFIYKIEQLIKKKKNIQQGALNELLTGKRRLKGFNEKWINQKLRDVTRNIRDGTHQTPTYVKNGIPFYSVESITDNNFTDTKYISKKDHLMLTKSFKIEKGDILMTRIGSIGDCKLIDWDVDASFYVSLALLKLNEKISPEFLYQYSKSNLFKKELEIRSLLWAVPKKINLKSISEIPICIPTSKKEQTAIAQIISDMDSEIKELETKRDKYVMIKNGMMLKLLTGEIRPV